MCKGEETKDVGKGSMTSKNRGNLGWILKDKETVAKGKQMARAIQAFSTCKRDPHSSTLLEMSSFCQANVILILPPGATRSQKLDV